jgi:uncharacterized repeat protein (TIGR03803 family)
MPVRCLRYSLRQLPGERGKPRYSIISARLATEFTPYGNLVIGAHGELYGTAWEGGPYGYGMVFKLRPPPAAGGERTETVLYTFTGQSDGANPWGLSMSA